MRKLFGSFIVTLCLFSWLSPAIGFMPYISLTEPNLLPTSNDKLLSLSLGEVAFHLNQLEQNARLKCECREPGMSETLSDAHNREIEAQNREELVMMDLLEQVAKLESEIEKLRTASGFFLANLRNVDAHKVLESEIESVQDNRTSRTTAGPSSISPKERQDGSQSEQFRNRKAFALLRTVALQKIQTVIELRTKIVDRAYSRNDAGLTWFQRALVYRNYNFIELLKGIMLQDQEGTLRANLINATSVGDLSKVKRLLFSGADYYYAPGEYSNLAMAKALGEPHIAAVFKNANDSVQVPWDPYASHSPSELMAALQNQLDRIAGFRRAVESQPDTYNAELLKYLQCRINCLNKAVQ